MNRRRLAAAVVGLIAFGCVLTACGGSSTSTTTATTTTTPAAPKSSSIVALGDSVPYGTNCQCTPYPPLSGNSLTASTGHTVATANDAVPGTTTAAVLKQVETDSAVIDHLRKADIVEIEVGANDVGYSSACGNTVSCYTTKIPTIGKNLDAIVRRVHELRAGQKTLVVLLDYWSVWLGGQYAAAKGQAYVNAAEEVTDQVNGAIKSTAGNTGSAYVDLRAAFKGPSYTYDETHYLSNDGDHPNASGHQKIAADTVTVIENALHI
jgi:lysophospholipase L1-like esterase